MDKIEGDGTMSIQLLHRNPEGNMMKENFLGKFSKGLVLFHIHKMEETKTFSHEFMEFDLKRLSDEDWLELEHFFQTYIENEIAYTFVGAPIMILKEQFGTNDRRVS